ncbi:unnamed protein product [Bursaphelenchus okinawaensis]|uniref:Uncharacterized protein n=1 Tax=Bursaphelenchus okinawaensis TaxID=465554 RepID=A0A811KS01_9BILA|nr:unnamed protein product [Bursaphelenchus okinawaensis]CAG9110703.1 unnamed protein product [Bursaphelenchus okinawaensis]
MNLSSAHCKLLQRVWRELREEKLKQIERPTSVYSFEEAASSSGDPFMALECPLNLNLSIDPDQHTLYQIVLGFVDNAVWELRSREFRLRLRAHCRRFGRQMAAVFRGTADLDQSLSWELLGLSQVLEGMISSSRTLNPSHQQSFRRNATKLIIWQLFLENLSTMVFEAFCWSVARDYTPNPLPTIYEADPKLCFPHRVHFRQKIPLLKRLLAKFSRGADKERGKSCSRGEGMGAAPFSARFVRSRTFCAEEC